MIRSLVWVVDGRGRVMIESLCYAMRTRTSISMPMLCYSTAHLFLLSIPEPKNRPSICMENPHSGPKSLCVKGGPIKRLCFRLNVIIVLTKETGFVCFQCRRRRRRKSVL
jgi:hypothetical protein